MLRKLTLVGSIILFSAVQAKDLARVRSIHPHGKVDTIVRTVFVKFDQDVVDDLSKKVDVGNSLSISGNSCEKTYWSQKNTLACDLKTLVNWNEETTVHVNKEFGVGESKITLAEDYEVKFIPQRRSDDTRQNSGRIPDYRQDPRNRIRSVDCSGKHNEVTSYYFAQNVKQVEREWIDCEWGSKVRFSFSNELTEDLPNEVIFVDDPDLQKKINEEIKENFGKRSYYGEESIEFSLPENERQYEFSLNREIFLQKLDYFGPSTIIISLHPRPYSFEYNRDMAVIERKGPWKLPFEYRNIDQLKYEYKVLNTNDFKENKPKVSQTYVVPLEFRRNIPEKWYVDLKKLPGVDPDEAQLFDGTFNLSDVGEEFKNSYNKFKNYYSQPPKDKRAVVLVTDLGIHFKKGYFNSQAFVFSLSDGKPVSRAKVTLYQGDKEIDSIKTNNDGIALFNHKTETLIGNFRIVAEKGDDFSFITNGYGYGQSYGHWSRGIEPQDFNISYRGLTERSNFIASAITDRPIYKPGDKVNLKVFTRRWSNESLSFIEDYDEINVNVKSSRSENVLNQKIKINKFGTAVVDLALPQNAKTGDYVISVAPNNGGSFVTAGEFQVEDFRTSPFKITTQATFNDSALNVDAVGEYHFGGKLAEAQGELLLFYQPIDFEPVDKELKRYFYKYYYYDEYDNNNDGESGSKIVLKEDFNFSKEGTYSQRISLDSLERKGDGRYYVEVSSKDNKGAKVAGGKSIEVFEKDGYLGARVEGWSFAEDTRIQPKIVMLSPEQKIVDKGKGKIELFKKEYFTTRRKGTGNYYYYDYTEKDELVDSCEFTFSKTLDSCDLKLQKSGTYFYRVSSLTAGDARPITRYVYVWGGSGYASQKHYNHSRIDLITDQEVYSKGDTAKILIKSPYAQAEAILTIERDGILESRRIQLNSSFYEYELKLDKKEYLPGVFISVLIIKGRTSDKIEGELDLGKPSFHLGYTKIDVISEESHVKLAATPKQKTFQPGEMVEIAITAKDFENKPIESELAVAIVDEAVLQLVSGYASKYKIHDDFYTLTYSGVLNFQTLINLVGRQTYGRKGGNAGGGGGVDQSLVRKDFKAVAHWEPQLLTNSKGEASVKFKAPDNLTGWRALIVAVDKNHRFGYTESSFKVAKPLMIIPALPNFLTEQDRFTAKYQVFNKTGQNQSVKVDVSSDTFHIPQASMTQEVKDEASEFFKFVSQTKGVGEYTITASASGGRFKDAMQTTIPVRPITATSIRVKTGVLTGNNVIESFEIPKEARDGSQSMSLSYSNELLKNLRGTFEYILTYPYGCWEQRMSKVITWAQYYGVKDSVGHIPTEKNADPMSVVREFIDLGPKYQNDDGGMKYYPSEYGESNIYLSIFTGEIFSMIKKMGIELPQDVVDKLIPYLRKRLDNSDIWPNYYSINTRETGYVRILYILSELGETNLDSYITKAVSQKENMSVEGKAYLLRVLSGRDKYKDSFKDLQGYFRKGLIKNSKGVSFKFQEPVEKYWLYTANRTQCQVFSALARTNSFKSDNDKHLMIEYLLRARSSGRWYNTQENMYCLTAAFDYLSDKNVEQKESMTVEALLDGKVIAKTKIDNTLSRDDKIVVDPSLLIKGVTQKVELRPSENKTTFYRVEQRFFDYNSLDESIDEGFQIKKLIFKLDQKNLKWEELSEDLNLKIGDILKIILVVTTDDKRHNVAINDPLAAAFEPINYNLDSSSKLTQFLDSPPTSTSYRSSPYAYRGDFFRGNGFHHVDLRLHAAQFYADQLSPGIEYRAEYSVSVGVEGSFLMDATKVEEMYYPDIYGTTPARKVTVSE